MSVQQQLCQVLRAHVQQKKAEIAHAFDDGLPLSDLWSLAYTEFRGYWLRIEGWSWDGWAFCNLVFLAEQIRQLDKEALLSLSEAIFKHKFKVDPSFQYDSKYVTMSWSLD